MTRMRETNFRWAELITGRHAFDAEGSANLIASVLRDEAAPMEGFAPITPVLDRGTSKSLLKDPDSRWQSAGGYGHQSVATRRSAVHPAKVL